MSALRDGRKDAVVHVKPQSVFRMGNPLAVPEVREGHSASF